ncbi:hypothetical protein ACIPRI_24470 [Variovorax sp. LARHSF232]
MHKKKRAPATALRLAMAGLALALTGCQMRSDVRPFSSEVPPPPQFASAAERCNAADARFALGQTMTPPLLDDARGRTGARSAITAKPGETPAPPDPMRLIIEVDPAGKMVGARCS